MDRPFRELHELYKIVYERAEAQAKAEKEREEREKKEREAEENRERARKGLPPLIRREPPPDAKYTTKEPIIPSPYGADDLEEAFEEITEGGAI